MRSYEDAARVLREELSWNPWFMESFWPENEPRTRTIVELARRAAASLERPRLLDLGCANGYMAYLFGLLGFDTTAVDAYDDEKRGEMFRKAGIAYVASNLNDARPLEALPDSSYDVVVMGEIFEHILNNPAGLLAAVFRVLKPNGLLVLTTPNPSTLANSLRLLADGYVLWGTPSFLRDVKLDEGRVIDRGDIHYREYPAWIVRDLLKELGFRIEQVEYYYAGTAPSHPLAKRMFKALLRATGLAKHRLFAFGYIIAARRPDVPGQK